MARARRNLKLPAPASLGRLRDYLAWLVERGETVRAMSIEAVVDVDRQADVALAAALAHRTGQRREERG